MAGPWEKYGGGASSGDPVIAPPDPYKQANEQRAQQDQALQVEAAARAAAAEARANRAEERADRSEARSIQKDQQGTVEQNKAKGFLTRGIQANKDYLKLGDIGPRSLPGQAFADAFPNAANTFTSDAQRQLAEQAERAFIGAILRYDSGAAIPPQEFVTQGQIYFPRPGDGPEVLAQKAKAREVALQGLKDSAGPSASDIVLDFGQPAEGDTVQYSQELPGGLTGSVTDDSPQLPPDGGGNQAALDIVNNPRLYGRPDALGQGGLATLGMQGISLGLSDEAAGVGGAIGSLLRGESPVQGYRDYRDAERIAIERARQSWGIPGSVAEIMGGGGAARLAPGAMSVGNALLQGAGIGAVGGYGYGEGTEGSALNAAGGAVLGGALGGGAQYVGNALARFAGPRAAENARIADNARRVAQAGEAEGVTVNRAMVDPRVQNRVSGVDSTLTGGPIVQRDMTAIERQIEGRVGDLGRGGSQLSDIEGGDAVVGAANRFIERSGKAAKVKYDRAEKLAGSAKVAPQESLRRVDEMISTLSETPNSNRAEIAFLQELKSDLANDLSVGALRRLRTNLRKKIGNGDLVFGEDEARVLAIMDGAADDIRAGLASQGNARAARAFDVADKAYAARMDYINNTVQKVVGKRNANLSSEQVYRRFESMAKGKDAVGLRRFYATMTPEEQADVAATFAQELGKNNKGDFSVAHFLSQSTKLSDDAARTIFGVEGAQSIQNLRVLSKEVNRVTSAMNSRTSKTAVANNYRQWLPNVIFGGLAGGGVGYATGDGSLGTAGAGALLGVGAARNVITARMLMSPKITKWIRTAPATTNPAAINAHFERLGEIAKVEPALAGEIKALQDAVMKAANDNSLATRSFASDENADNRPREAD